MAFKFLIMVIMVHVFMAFKFKCPEPAQWSLRARSHCPDPSKYFCLKNDLINGYSENCTVFDFLQPGRKHVLRGGLDADICSSERYQPWPIKFYTNVSTNCIFLKFTCSEEGQVVNDNGNRNTDTTCKCDYTRGYNFLHKPKHFCYCNPLEEDCSCYLKTCPDSTFTLSADYECISSRMNISMTQCRPFMNGRDTKDRNQNQTQHISRTGNISSQVLWKKFAGISTCVICIGLIFVFCGNALLDKYYRTVHFILGPDDDVNAIEGQSVSLKYKLLINRFAITYKRRTLSSGEANHISITDAGRVQILMIKHIALTDEGEYCLEAEGIQSKSTKLTVKPLFKRPLEVSKSVEGSNTIFECESEKDYNNVKWYKDNVKITDNTEKLETEEGYIYKFTIKKTHVKDSGTYRIQKNGIRSEVILAVKVLFKRPLKDLTSVEGSNTIFECETEKENGAVEWYKDDVKMTVHPDKLETEQGYIYKITINHTRVKDSGTYRIEINGICSEAGLEVKALFKQPLKKIHILEGSDIVFDCKTEKESGVVEWFRGEVKIADRTANIEVPDGYIYKLAIKHADVQKEGTYRIVKNGIVSEAALEIKALFKRPLNDITIMEGLDIQFECETEAENSSIEWFKNDVLITVTTGNQNKETLTENIHKLTISPARLLDSGRYRIEKNGISSEAVLDVKEMPETIKQMSQHDREEFLKATQSGTAQRFYIRVMIVGESSAGKTCLLRRLMNKPINDVISTDGLDIERQNCQVEIKTGEWHFPTVDRDSYSVWSGQNEELADCRFWDFAGQKEFYATHQTFLSTNAVYLLVADISKDFSNKTYHDMIENKFDSLGEYIDFWLDNVHCYRKDVHNASRHGVELNPPIVMVGTGIDKITLDEREDIQQNFQNHLSKILSNHEKRRHLRKTHFLSNTFPSNNREEFEKLREDIFVNAKSLKNWGDNLPSRWIVLEKVIYSKISEAKYTMSYAEAIELAAESSFPDLKQNTSELDSFLKYEHDIGNIIFFEDVKEFIVLDLKWLVDLFRCFVSNQYGNELINMTEWSELENKGKLSNNLIVKLLEKVPHLSLMKHTTFALQIMEKFDIIVKPKNDEASEFFYMPCMIKTVTLNTILKDIGAENCKKKTSWFILEFDFLPPSYFNHILVSFVKEKRLSTKHNNELCIYRNIGLFDINDSRTRVLMICLSQNAIAMQVLQWNLESHCYSDFKGILIDRVCSLKQRYHINITFANKFKCSEGNCFEKEGRVDFSTVMAEKEYRCTEHKDTHQRTDIIESWLTDKEIDEEYKNKGYTKCHFCDNISVYKCYDCNHALCKDCSSTHNDKNKYQSHSIQLISNSFILNCNFSLIPDFRYEIISDMKCLPNGEAIVSFDVEQVVKTFSVIGIQRHVIQLEDSPLKITVVDKTTVAVLLGNNSMAFVDIQQIHVQYINNIAIPNMPCAFICIENEFYIGNEYDIVVIDMSGGEKRRITLSFKPFGMSYGCDSQRIYCIEHDIDTDSSELVCIERDGSNIFTFADPSMTNLQDLTIDNDGNVLVLCKKKDERSGYVIKVDSNGETSEVVITNINMSSFNQHICYDHLTDSVVIASDNEVYVYKKK